MTGLSCCVRKDYLPSFSRFSLRDCRTSRSPNVALSVLLSLILAISRACFEPIIDNGWVRANRTTLGADNGIGVCAALACVTTPGVKHGPMEILVTIDEETGMTGAFGLKKGFVKGKILINLDSETEGELYVGCAGGLDANFERKYTMMPTPEDMKGFKLIVTGLHGGHSGMDINLGRANANKIAVRFITRAVKDFGACLASLSGGSLRNAICHIPAAGAST